ncbi:hypothetical protein UFOVP336_19 [uncultured Caudovirales phage]|uniref:Uncharacterized protein n=1 Tax=uncultured Caudovirales phage TaxID=2100421 RepID=A0A6J5M233_9CAUD|nr:hypothetical protein UFOVP336_19 [uncultured Caudovirales phage]
MSEAQRLAKRLTAGWGLELADAMLEARSKE